MQLMDLLFEAEIKMIFPLPVTLMVLRFGFSISDVDFVYTHVSHKYMDLKSTSNYVMVNFLPQNDVQKMATYSTNSGKCKLDGIKFVLLHFQKMYEGILVKPIFGLSNDNFHPCDHIWFLLLFVLNQESFVHFFNWHPEIPMEGRKRKFQ